MISYQTEDELKAVLAKYNLPELIFTGRKDAGPDEELYFYEDKVGRRYGLWSRDYMSELNHEAEYLQGHFGLVVKKWLKTAEDELTTDFAGDTYAAFML